jgi:Flp pilus assembly protein TadG
VIHKLLQLKLDRRGSFALEFAIVAPVFLVLLFMVFEIAYDEFMQEVLDNTLQSSARQVQIGNTQSATTATFVQNYMCPYDSGLFNCNNLFVRIQEVTFTPGSCSDVTNAASATGDFYDATTVGLPLSNGVLQLGGFYNGAGAQGNGSTLNLSPCATASSGSGYCNVGSQQFILMTAIYVAPSFLNGLVLNHITYGGKYVRAMMSVAAFETEPFTGTTTLTPC